MLETDEQISSNILSNRLKKLEKDGLIASICHPESKRRKLYYLTGKGKDLIHIMFEMVLWGKKNISHLLAIPEDQLNLLNTDPDKYKSLVLLQTEEWEKEYLHGQ